MLILSIILGNIYICFFGGLACALSIIGYKIEENYLQHLFSIDSLYLWNDKSKKIIYYYVNIG